MLGEYEYSIGKVLTRLAPTALVRIGFRRLNPMGNSSLYEMLRKTHRPTHRRGPHTDQFGCRRQLFGRELRGLLTLQNQSHITVDTDRGGVQVFFAALRADLRGHGHRETSDGIIRRPSPD
jgi:hypothetical protein